MLAQTVSKLAHAPGRLAARIVLGERQKVSLQKTAEIVAAEVLTPNKYHTAKPVLRVEQWQATGGLGYPGFTGDVFVSETRTGLTEISFRLCPQGVSFTTHLMAHQMTKKNVKTFAVHIREEMHLMVADALEARQNTQEIFDVLVGAETGVDAPEGATV